MAQFARPDADQATGSWTTTPLWSKVEEGVASADGTVIQSDDNTSPDNADLRLSDVTDPEVSTGHIIRVHWRKDSSAGHQLNPFVELWQGIPGTGTSIATLSITDLTETTLTTDSYTLSEGEANSITDYTDLYLRVSRTGDTGGNPNGRRFLEVDAVELEVPDASTERTVQVSAAEIETPNAARQIQISAAEFEAGNAARTIQTSAFEFETPNAARQIQVSAAELEAPNAARRIQVSAAEFETPSTNRRVQISAAEFESPNAARLVQVSAVEVEAPPTQTRVQISAFEFTIPSVGADSGSSQVEADRRRKISRRVPMHWNTTL